MSYDDDAGFYHLRPGGWVRQDNEPFPNDRIETWRFTMHQSWVTQPEYYDFKCLWADDRVSETKRNEIRDAIGMPIRTGTGAVVRIRRD